MKRTKKLKSAARFRAGYGIRVKKRLIEIEGKQRKKQACPFCKKGTAKRISSGIWRCKKCGKKFASNAYYLKK